MQLLSDHLLLVLVDVSATIVYCFESILISSHLPQLSLWILCRYKHKSLHTNTSISVPGIFHRSNQPSNPVQSSPESSPFQIPHPLTQKTPLQPLAVSLSFLKRIFTNPPTFSRLLSLSLSLKADGRSLRSKNPSLLLFIWYRHKHAFQPKTPLKISLPFHSITCKRIISFSLALFSLYHHRYMWLRNAMLESRSIIRKKKEKWVSNVRSIGQSGKMFRPNPADFDFVGWIILILR